ncbi:hypothetical protein NHX12_017813 [Muraenolepis orangiensis]|uniref:Uncharacterized protein n=1 Tax=Muraenolepis orangiensis TaxID=630683 RepID=A0A9Q0EVV7_9TELE|nr:hypothetical protein NHX12_017813 [Muraenolepis orangiensis]
MGVPPSGPGSALRWPLPAAVRCEIGEHPGRAPGLAGEQSSERRAAVQLHGESEHRENRSGRGRRTARRTPTCATPGRSLRNRVL